MFRAFQQAGTHSLVDLHIAGGDNGGRHKVLIKEVQRDPVRDEFVHVDFHAVALDQEMQTAVPVDVQGEEARTDNGVVQLVLREVNISCLPTDIPEAIAVDVSDLAIGDVVTVAQLTAAEGRDDLERPRGNRGHRHAPAGRRKAARRRSARRDEGAATRSNVAEVHRRLGQSRRPTYERTRHNMGFLVIDELARDLVADGWRRWMGSPVAKANLGRRQLFLVKPMTYMNLSGEAVQPLLRYYRMRPGGFCWSCTTTWICLRVRCECVRPGGAGGHAACSPSHRDARKQPVSDGCASVSGGLPDR